MRVLLTGSTGFIGSCVLARLLAANFSVRVLIRPESLIREAGRRIMGLNGVEIILGNLLDSATLIEATRDIDVIIHLAWQWSSDKDSGVQQPVLSQLAETNVKGTEYLLRAAVMNRVRRIVFSSSVAVYGPPHMLFQWPITEQSSLMQRDYDAGAFEKDYMEPKIAIENMIRCFSSAHELGYVILRPSVVYGAEAPFADEMVRNSLDRRGSRPEFNSRQAEDLNSKSKCQWVHVSDVATAILLAMIAPTATNKEINIAGDDVATMEEINDLIYAAASDFQLHLPLTGRPRSQLNRALGYESRRYDLTQARTCLGFTPAVSLNVGIAEMVFAIMQAQTANAQTNNKQQAILTERDRTLPAPHSQMAERQQRGGPGAEPPPQDRHPAHRSLNPTDIGAVYDAKIGQDFLETYFGHSDFWNFGFRDERPATPRQACENLVDKLLGFIPHRQGTILDVACGKGATTRHLLKYYRPEQVYAINISRVQLERCRINAPGCNFQVMDATNLKFPEGTFDNIICVEAAFHFQTRQKFMQEARRVLKPGGRLVLSDMLLPPWIQTQPPANFVRNLVVYRKKVLRAGFADVDIMDVTENSWGRFYDDLHAYMRQQIDAGAITQQRWEELASWLHQVSPLYYVLVCCRKD